MPTFQRITSTTLGSPSSNILFSSIPSTYTDLYVYANLRSTNASNETQFQMRLNGDTASNYFQEQLRYNSSSVDANGSFTSSTFFVLGDILAANIGSGFYSSTRIYIGSYTNSFRKQVSSEISTTTPSYMAKLINTAGMWTNTASINSIELFLSGGGVQFAAGSTAYLYGISNA